MAAAASIPADEGAGRADDLRTKWLEEHERKLKELESTLSAVDKRMANLGPGIEERIQNPEYLTFVRKAFQTWDRAETEEKRRYVANHSFQCCWNEDLQ